MKDVLKKIVCALLKLYMYDWMHMTRTGYLKWWTPYFETKIGKCLA